MRMHDGGLRLLSAAGLAWLAVGASPVTTSTTGQTQARPNIVLIVADDLNTRLGTYGLRGPVPQHRRARAAGCAV